MIELVEVSKEYGDFRALDRVSLTVPDGGIVGVIGPNGAGKSTLIRLINQLERPTAGSVRLNGTELTGL
ncbi:ATP-binding cassette domain-containing protein, partial [Kitasatospora nipponensis]|uniref:ATP-binding cassette domain-containing protein n=1 Tax=Kitasatospora nipponensis TaxID=258049 RepID=UPI0031DDEA45